MQFCVSLRGYGNSSVLCCRCVRHIYSVRCIDRDIEIRPTLPDQIPEVVKIYDKARSFMRQTGNIHQWSPGYPGAASLRQDIERGSSYVCIKDGRVVGTFCFVIDQEPTYKEIYDGAWLNDREYGVVHRVASDGSVKHMMHIILDFCLDRISNIRIDTHRDNAVMQRSLLSYGFEYCGIIHLADGDPRLAYQYTSILPASSGSVGSNEQ